jgi:hypothetical protein
MSNRVENIFDQEIARSLKGKMLVNQKSQLKDRVVYVESQPHSMPRSSSSMVINNNLDIELTLLPLLARQRPIANYLHLSRFPLSLFPFSSLSSLSLFPGSSRTWLSFSLSRRSRSSPFRSSPLLSNETTTANYRQTIPPTPRLYTSTSLSPLNPTAVKQPCRPLNNPDSRNPLYPSVPRQEVPRRTG